MKKIKRKRKPSTTKKEAPLRKKPKRKASQKINKGVTKGAKKKQGRPKGSKNKKKK